jgi:hypothetical protein
MKHHRLLAENSGETGFHVKPVGVRPDGVVGALPQEIGDQAYGPKTRSRFAYETRCAGMPSVADAAINREIHVN